MTDRDLIDDLTTTLPNDFLSRERERRTRDRILRSARTRQDQPPQRHWSVIAIGLTVAAAAAVVVWVATAKRGPVVELGFHGSVLPSEGAQYERTGAIGEEVVHVRDGVVTFDVRPLAKNQFFRVIVGDHRIEVRGTVFHIAASRDRLMSVSVAHGRVEIHSAGVEPVDLRAGEHWSDKAGDAQEESAEANPKPASSAARDRLAPAVKRPATASPGPVQTTRERRPLAEIESIQKPRPNHGQGRDVAEGVDPLEKEQREFPGEAEFRAGWFEFEAGDYGRAASTLGRSCVAAGDAALGRDACFWHSKALERAGRSAAASASFRRYLKRWPNASRSDDARVALGWLLLSNGDLSVARRLFEKASSSRVPSIRASARRGLRACSDSVPER